MLVCKNAIPRYLRAFCGVLGFSLFFVFVLFRFCFPFKILQGERRDGSEGSESFNVQHPGRLSASAEVHACEDVGILFVFHFLLP